MTRVLGVDPGTRRAGWGVIERVGSSLRGIAAGVIKMDESAPLAERLGVLHLALSGVIADHGPTDMAVEDIFFAKHANAALKLGHARGVVLLCASQRGLRIGEYPPATIKRAIAGRGRADKEQVARMVMAILSLREQPAVDATDALAVAIAHALSAR